MLTSEKIDLISAALVEAQAEMPVVPMNAKNPFFNSKFADFGSVIETTRPILKNHGLAITQFPTSTPDNRIGVTSRLIHKSGQWFEESVYIPLPEKEKAGEGEKQKKSPNLAQATGIAITYLKRYSWTAILGVYADEDTDGESGKREEAELTEEELELKKLKKEIVTLGKALGGKENSEISAMIKEHIDSGNPNDIENIGIAKTLLKRLEDFKLNKKEEKPVEEKE
jgi:hypothetical protein